MLKQVKDTLTSKKLYISIVAIGVALVGLLLLFNYVVMPWYTNYAEGLTVPDVTRMPLEEAKATLTAYGLQYEVADHRKNASYPAGFVIDQQPNPSELVKPHRKIYLTVNMAHHIMVEVPKVVNLSLRSAKIQLQNAGLKIGSISYESSRFKNTVLRQSIKAGEMVKKGTRVDLAIGNGLGRRKVAMPEIIGMRLRLAQKQLRRSELLIGEVHYRPKPEVPPGTVIDFKPHKKRVEINTKITLIVAEKVPKTPKLLNDSTKVSNE